MPCGPLWRGTDARRGGNLVARGEKHRRPGRGLHAARRKLVPISERSTAAHRVRSHVSGTPIGAFRRKRLAWVKTDTADKIGLHASYFLGTSVTRAHGAESCGVPGMRILLHPALVLPQDYPEQTIDVPPYKPKNKIAVRQELCCLHTMTHEWSPEEDRENTWSAKNRRMRKAIEKMREWSPEDKHFQYDETLKAFWLMRERQSLPIIIDPRDFPGAEDE